MEFAARVEDSLRNVITPPELTMQKLLPAYEEVNKLRHEAQMQAHSSLKLSVESLHERLDQFETSSASFRPVWFQRGKSGTWNM
jgi:hypothetical protein